MTTVTISKWGNSNGIRIPSQLLKKLNLFEGMELELSLTKENHILLKPLQHVETNEDLRLHLKSLLAKITPDTERHEELDWGIEGDEII